MCCQTGKDRQHTIEIRLLTLNVKSPTNGGPPLTGWEVVLGIVAVVALATLLVLWG